MTTVLNLTGVSLPSGITQIPQTAVPANVTQATLTLARCTTPTPTLWASVATTLKLDLEVSYDGGVTWLYGGGMTAAGGIALTAQGAECPATIVTFGYATHPTHIRGTLTVASGPLLTTASLTVS